MLYTIAKTERFQFPTGWNSTRRKKSGERQHRNVSIPNGMEFYPVPNYKYHNFFPSFNSQRDGILQNILFINHPLANVSIPNGMEFYLEAIIKNQPAFCFNSQRDGILLPASADSNQNIITFQFPTGWNSTCFRGYYHKFKRVSIPNGMEFYFDSRYAVLLQKAFQFPTGWNSTLIIRYPSKGNLVSIPNGMEFYNEGVPFTIKDLAFQFPTGWNSTSLATYSGGTPAVSIPNGMEFYENLLGYKIEKERFQFPTGWNSTRARLIARDQTAKCFNSQRDGILPLKGALSKAKAAFQFPTGWNSTRWHGRERANCRAVSIPNGMEFYARAQS